jgi:hypothetical protein
MLPVDTICYRCGTTNLDEIMPLESLTHIKNTMTVQPDLDHMNQ